MVRLEGSAHFARLPAPSGAAAPGDTGMFTLFTARGMVTARLGEFLVSTRGDTTDVEVLGAEVPHNDPRYVMKMGRQKADSVAMPDVVMIANGPEGPFGM